ncbi:hypothetical protein HU200_064631 [Digitaria exilis]|uniref:At1g61320/AtMIF1 LRR domain-containing protein n=1 Tax=Digitaria exilis TaxID=1010633 RepID=A0A834ZZJ5_9POAL|nr:hypothetical protein HU200_064631 [Digitaria exilis]
MQDVLYRIASKLQQKEFARTSILSGEWRRISSSASEFWNVWEYISEVDAVLQKHQNKVVEALQFDPGSISRLQDMQLCFVSLSSPPPWFKGFPNLKRLHLQILQDNRKDLEHLLSLCRALEWLCIDRCNLEDDELTVDTPLSRLTYLRVERCRLTKIRFNAVNLATFEYDGNFIPIDLVSSFKLKSANIEFDEAVFHHALVSLLNGLPNVQNLTLKIGLLHLEKQWLWDNALKFSNLRNLQLSMFIWRKYVDKILYAVSFLRATPFIEKLEVHVSDITCFSMVFNSIILILAILFGTRFVIQN